MDLARLPFGIEIKEISFVVCPGVHYNLSFKYDFKFI